MLHAVQAMVTYCANVRASSGDLLEERDWHRSAAVLRAQTAGDRFRKLRTAA